MPTAPHHESRKTAAPLTERTARVLLLLLINLFNYLDRYVLAAVEPQIQKQFFPDNPPNAEAWMALLRPRSWFRTC